MSRQSRDTVSCTSSSRCTCTCTTPSSTCTCSRQTACGSCSVCCPTSSGTSPGHSAASAHVHSLAHRYTYRHPRGTQDCKPQYLTVSPESEQGNYNVHV